MADVSVTNTFVDATVAEAAEVNTNFTDLVAYINARQDGGTAWDGGKFTAQTVHTGGIQDLYGINRPPLKPVSATQVDVAENTGTNNQTSIVFPDGIIRSVIEDVSSTNVNRRFDITATANFTSGTEDSGIRSGESEGTNEWWALYAVKSSINSSNFVIVGTKTLPLQANVATLNTDLNGANAWRYIGLIRNGDSSGATGDILDFDMFGDQTIFNNSCAAVNNLLGLGTLIGGGTATSSAYTFSAGTGDLEVPNNIGFVMWTGSGAASGGILAIGQAAGVVDIERTSAEVGSSNRTLWLPAVEGISVRTTNSVGHDLYLSGFTDAALSSPFGLV